ncbi:S9 family peptidase [Streptomyces sp. NRRL F-2664]|uniref:S9 family peptidase n=1 Tax=Streptomyces sp. NRRL F-2664 TaxID=1463842 RepID=UPI0004C4AF10|nr:prolyl oligopeptidase family serine peptidase [Streptomyces sp. NRRL F-2664]
MLPTDIDLLRILGRPTLSGDGRLAAVSVTAPDAAADANATELWVAATDGSTPARRLTRGPSDSAPAFSPDGRWLAFLRPLPAGGPAQIHLLPMDGGDPFPVTDLPLGAGQPAWSPDGTRLAFTARVPEPGRYLPGVPPGKERPRRITALRYMADGLGFTFDRPRHVFVTAPFATGAFAAAPAAAQLTSGPFDHDEVAWSPDGSQLTFVSGRHPGHADDLRRDVWICAPDGTGQRPLTRGGLEMSCPQFSPDGRNVHFAAETLTPDGRARGASSYGLWSVPSDGSADPVRLTDPETHHLSFSSLMIRTGRDGVYFPNDWHGEVHLVLVPYDGGEPRPVVTGLRQVNGFAVAEAPDGTTTVAAVLSSAESAGDLTLLRDGTERELTSFGAELRARARLRPIEEFTAHAEDGYPLQGWLVRPEGPGPHPVLLQIKGGPYTQWGYTLNGPASFEEAQVYARAGYAVVLGNPRGTSGYGQAHGRWAADDLARRTAPDLLALLDHALRDTSLDADRVGVQGGSFGGYMSAWLAAHHGKRFRAAMGERGCYAIDSHFGSADDGVNNSIALYGADTARWAELSPISYADRIDIPMMFIQSEEDRHTPMEQAQRMFVALKMRGVPVELLLFPGEGHDMSRTGLPSHRIARYEAILDWWSRQMPEEDDCAPAH